MSIAQILKFKRHIPKGKPDRQSLETCEAAFLNEDIVVASGRKIRQIDNTFVSSIFSKYPTLSCAIKQFYWLDDILTGVARLDMGGNTRPLSLSVLYDFLSESGIINTTIISSYCGIGTRQAQKVMLSLTIANRMCEKELRRMGFTDENIPW